MRMHMEAGEWSAVSLLVTREHMKRRLWNMQSWGSCTAGTITCIHFRGPNKEYRACSESFQKGALAPSHMSRMRRTSIALLPSAVRNIMSRAAGVDLRRVLPPDAGCII